MSLSSLLLAKSGADVDNELDSLFKHAPKPIERPTAPAATATTSTEPIPSSSLNKNDDASSKKKRKVVEAAAGPSSAKKVKTEAAPKDKKKKEKKTKEPLPAPKKTKSAKLPAAPAGGSSEDEDNNSDLENQYLAGKQKADDAMDVDEPEEESDADVDPSTLVHESLKAGGKSSSRSGKQKYVPAEETPEKRDQRTVFVGNLPLAVASKRPLQKQLNKHILTLVPNAKIESVRFRSVPFQTPTSKLPTSDDEGDSSSKLKKKPLPPQSKSFSERPDNHATKRSSTYKTKLAAADDDDVIKQDEKQFLTPAQKKKIAFIHQDFHNEADSVNAYVVFAHPVPKDNWPKNLPPPKETMDPYEAAAMAVERCNNTMFMERIIRVDRVGQVAKGLAKVAAKEGEEDAPAGALVDADPKFTVFVGNLDFASKEEDLRAFFENLMVAEKGAREDDGEEEEGVKKARTWVVRVRIVRDKDTQLGKGFAYVQFADKECVDEVLAMDETKLKFAKRKLRVQRCKTLPGSSVKVKPSNPKSKDGKDKKPGKVTRGAPVVVPKGDPTLGERLAHLPKEVRKQAKAADGDRIARRMAKKKARMAMGAGKDKVGDKERLRPTKGKKTVNSGKKTGKPRVRNEKNAERRNTKK